MDQFGAIRYKQNRDNFRYQTINLLKMWFLLLVSSKEQKKDKSEFGIKLAEIIVPTILI